MREDLPFAVPEAPTLPGSPPSVSTAIEGRGLAHSAPNLPHRRAHTLTAWRSARAWIEAAYPSGLDAARPELAAKFPELLASIDRLEQAAQQAANHREARGHG
jgi:hypothetical protein